MATKEVSTQYAVVESWVMPGTFWVVDTTKPKNVEAYRVEWADNRADADRECKARNEGKTRVCAPRSEETKEKMRVAREARKKDKENGTQHPKTPSNPGKQPGRKRTAK